MLSQKNQAADICRLLQISQDFRGSDKYSFIAETTSFELTVHIEVV